MIGYKEAAGCFCVLWPVALHHHHSSASNTRGHKTKADPIGCATTSFYQARLRSNQQPDLAFTSCYFPCPHKHLECLVRLACWLISAIPPACSRRNFQLDMQRCSSRHYELRFCNTPYSSWSFFTSCIWCGRWDLWVKVQLVHWSNLQSSLSWPQALQVLLYTTSKHHLPHLPESYTLQQVISLKILQGWTLKISKAVPDLVSSPSLFFLTPQHWPKLAGFICRQIDQEILELEELPLLYSGCITSSLCPKQLAGVPRKRSACCWFQKDVYLHSNLHEVEAILKASAVTCRSIIPIQKPEPDQTYSWIETHRSQHTKEVAH